MSPEQPQTQVAPFSEAWWANVGAQALVVAINFGETAGIALLQGLINKHVSLK